MSSADNLKPIGFKVSYWFAFGFSLVFLLYGGVKIILGFLDHNYTDLPKAIIFLLIGIVLVTLADAYKGLKPWSWYGQVVINGLIMLLAIIGYSHYENLILLVLAGTAMFFLFSSETKEYVLKGD